MENFETTTKILGILELQLKYNEAVGNMLHTLRKEPMQDTLSRKHRIERAEAKVLEAHNNIVGAMAKLTISAWADGYIKVEEEG